MAEDAHRRRTVREETAELTLEASLVGTELCIRLLDHSEPATGAPTALLALVDAGLATAVETRLGDGANVSELRLPLPSHGRLVDAGTLEVLDDEVAITDAEVEFTELTPEHAAALTRCLYRCYGWSYPSPSMYYPDRIAAALEAGTRVGEVAVDANGEVAAHWGAVFLTDGVVETGGTVTDPRFRRRGLANVLGDRLLERLVAMGVHGRLREPVLTPLDTLVRPLSLPPLSWTSATSTRPYTLTELSAARALTPTMASAPQDWSCRAGRPAACAASAHNETRIAVAVAE